MTYDIRPMQLTDVEAVEQVRLASDEALDREAGRPWEAPSEAATQRLLQGTRRFVELDPEGAWVAEDAQGLVGMAESVRRGGFWGLSMLFVHPRAQSQGVGRRLLDKTLDYAEGADVRMIMASDDPRALRRYSRAGLSIHPGVQVEGKVDPANLPPELPGRTGTDEDLDLVADVDATIGRTRRDDAAFVLEGGGVLEIVEDGTRRGFGIHREGHLVMLGATDNETATAVFRRMLAGSVDHKIQLWCLTAGQDWAVRAALDAGLSVKPGGSMFVSGAALPEPWIPSGWYF